MAYHLTDAEFHARFYQRPSLVNPYNGRIWDSERACAQDIVLEFLTPEAGPGAYQRDLSMVWYWLCRFDDEGLARLTKPVAGVSLETLTHYFAERRKIYGQREIR